MLSLFIVALCFSSSTALHFVFCAKGINVTKAYAAATDRLEIYYMQAPAFEGAFGDLFKSIGGYHSAFGIINRSNNKTYTLEYDAVSEVLNATLPIVSKLPNGTVELDWYNGGNNCLQEGMNVTYYSVGVQLATTINGTVWNKFLQWTLKDNATYTEYQLSYVIDEWKGPLQTTFFINSSTCYDFNWRGFQALYNLGATLNSTQVFKHDYISYFASVPPVAVDYNDPEWKERINAYYVAWDFHKHDVLEDLIRFLIEILLGDKFMYANGQYWYLKELHHPYFKNIYDFQCLPGVNCSSYPPLSVAAAAIGK